MISPILPAAIVPTGPSPASLKQILRAVRTHLDMEVGFVSEFLDGRRVFRHVECADANACIEVGGSDPLEESYCHWIAQGELPQLIRDPADHPLAARLPATRAIPVGAHLSVPIRLRDGRVYGTFCCFSSQPDRSLNDRDLATIEAFAQLASEQIQETIDSDTLRQAKLSKITRILRERDLRIVYQPVLRLDAPRVEFVEALARFQSKPYQTPDRWFSTASEVGLGAELELVAVKMALAGLGELNDRISLSINLSPETILNDGLDTALSGVPLHRLILEITEHEAIAQYSRLNRVLAPLRRQGLRLAVDDMGAGYSGLRHILQLRPDLIKLDMSLSRGIDEDPARRALASALISFSREIDSELVAEGVETEGELDTLRSLGVNLVQGFLLGRPATLDQQQELLRLVQ